MTHRPTHKDIEPENSMKANRIAAIQMTSKMSVSENLASAARLIQEAVHQGAGLIVLPEAFSIFHSDPLEKVRK